MPEQQNQHGETKPFEPLPSQVGLGFASKATIAAAAAGLNLAVPGIAVPTAAVTAGAFGAR